MMMNFLVSYLGRVARLNGLPRLADLLLDLGLDPAAFHSGDCETIERLSVLFDVNPKSAAAQTFKKGLGEVCYFSGQPVAGQHLLRGQFRICPACLRQDIGSDLNSSTAFQAYARVVWSLIGVKCCPEHGLLLVYPPESGPPHEFSQSWEPWLLELLDGDLDQPTESKGKFETYAARILRGESPPRAEFLAHLTLGDLGLAAETFGLSDIHGAKWLRKAMTDGQMALAMDAGFDVLMGGEPMVNALFDRLRVAPGEPPDRPTGRYGQVYEWLRRGSGSGKNMVFLHKILALHIQNNWPLGPGDLGFSRKVTKRR